MRTSARYQIVALVLSACIGAFACSSGETGTFVLGTARDTRTSTPDPGFGGPGPGVGGQDTAPSTPEVFINLGDEGGDAFTLPPINLGELDLKWDKTRTGPDPQVGADVYLFVFSYTSGVYAGADLEHDAWLFVPTAPQALANNTLAVIELGEFGATAGTENETFRLRFGAEVARDLGVAVLVVDLYGDGITIPASEAPSALASVRPECVDTPLFGDELASCGVGAVAASGDGDLDPISAIMAAFLRGEEASRGVIQLAVQVRPELPFDALFTQRLLFAGDGLAGLAARALLDVEERADAAMVAGGDVAALDSLADLQREVWPDGPYWLDPDVLDGLAGHDAGRSLAKLLDPLQFDTKLPGKRLAVAVGTVDPRTPLGALELYASSLHAEMLATYIVDLEKGLGAQEHLDLWRVMVDRTVSGAVPPRVVANITADGAHTRLSASVSGCEALQGRCTVVSAWAVSHHKGPDDADFRDAKWKPIQMTMDPSSNAQGQVGFFGIISRGGPRHGAVFVHVADIVETFTRRTTSRLIFTGEPYPAGSGQ